MRCPTDSSVEYACSIGHLRVVNLPTTQPADAPQLFREMTGMIVRPSAIRNAGGVIEHVENASGNASKGVPMSKAGKDGGLRCRAQNTILPDGSPHKYAASGTTTRRKTGRLERNSARAMRPSPSDTPQTRITLNVRSKP